MECEAFRFLYSVLKVSEKKAWASARVFFCWNCRREQQKCAEKLCMSAASMEGLR